MVMLPQVVVEVDQVLELRRGPLVAVSIEVSEVVADNGQLHAVHINSGDTGIERIEETHSLPPVFAGHTCGLIPTCLWVWRPVLG